MGRSQQKQLTGIERLLRYRDYLQTHLSFSPTFRLGFAALVRSATIFNGFVFPTITQLSVQSTCLSRSANVNTAGLVTPLRSGHLSKPLKMVPCSS
jgi:hypothetical protein